jgi:hypothetical protein
MKLNALFEWSGASKGVHTVVPREGVTTSLVRSIRIGACLAAVRDRLRGMKNDPYVPEVMARTGTAALLSVRHGRTGPGRRPLPDAALLPVAAGYDAALRRGSRQPIADVAEQLDWDKAKVRKYVWRARRPPARLLTGADTKRAQGELTAKGLALLAAMQRTRRAPTRGTKRRARRARATPPAARRAKRKAVR